MVAGSPRCLPKCEDSREPTAVRSASAPAASDANTHAETRAPERGSALRVEGLRAAGLLATEASTEASSQARAFGVIKTPGGKSCKSIRRLSVIRLLTMPLATRSEYLIH